jgi:hypothetical protein
MPHHHTPIDLIGDIHGHADELEALMKKLGYTNAGGEVVKLVGCIQPNSLTQQLPDTLQVIQESIAQYGGIWHPTK